MGTEASLIIQSDLTILLDDRLPAAAARELLLASAEAVKRVGSMHTYRITPMTLWHALSAGWTAEEVVGRLKEHARYGLPMQAEDAVRLWAGRFGKLKLYTEDTELVLSGEAILLQQLKLKGGVHDWVKAYRSDTEWLLKGESRGVCKQELTKLGYHVVDLAGYHAGQALDVSLRSTTARGAAFALRPYQREAVQQFSADGEASGGSGVVVLPCGTGKTIVGAAAMAELRAETLILTASRASAEQWREELLDKTTLAPEAVGIYSGQGKQVKPVTIATYQLLTYRKTKSDAYKHMGLFNERDWGLIIYDEVHLLPAPVFRMTASIQATRRLGLTATLVREDGCAEDVYSLIGPKHYVMNWKLAEEQSYISTVSCAEIRIPLADGQRDSYVSAAPRSKLRIAAENGNKLPVVRELLRRHRDKPTLVIGQYLNQLKTVAGELNAPLLTGETPQEERLRLYEAFRSGQHHVLVVSKVANLAIDLPDAAVAIQLSGSFGSRQEEAQRVGRLLRPKSGSNEAWFYTLVTEGTKETEFALKRQMFMLEQGYDYIQLPLPGDGVGCGSSVQSKEAAQG
ncbi:DNA repair helicase XPB [Paenibacillus sp. PL2-23]|uniref:DNA repair helicase XPB n=1 Tax=Paenibacillus sp. PL2-23 TaxID=2100729 RepID=UPI0030F54AF6